MKNQFRLAIIGLLVAGLISPLPARAELKDGITPCGSAGQIVTFVEGFTFVCVPTAPKSKKMVFRRLFAGSKQEPVVVKGAPSTLVIQSAPKPIPALIPNTSIPWPVPTGDLYEYKGVTRNEHAIDQLGLRELNNSGVTGKGYSVAFIDSTIIKSHPNFSDSEVVCVSAAPNNARTVSCPVTEQPSHGQGVAGTIGGKYGAATGARLISISGDMVSGLEWVLKNYKEFKIAAVSLSIGASGPRRNTLCGVAVPLGFKEVLEKLSKEDIAVLFSTANQGTINWVREPNCVPGVISVASVKAVDPTVISEYSSISPDIDLLAPADFLSSGSKGKDEPFGGTSQATPFAAALFALGKEARPDANIAQIFYYIKKTAAPIDDEYVKAIPVIRPVEMVAALKAATVLPNISLVKEIQVKSAG